MSYINENSFSRWIIEKSDGLTTLGLLKLSESVRDYAYLILTSQTSTRGPIVGHEVTRAKGYFTHDINGGGDNMYTADNICKMIEFLIDNIFLCSLEGVFSVR